MEILHIEDVSFAYPESEKQAVEHVNGRVNAGDFVVICGESGCGKTTLLKLLKRELAPAGCRSGRIFYKGVAQEQLDERTAACEIGYVLQNPDNQIVTDKVWHELAFGLENARGSHRGYPSSGRGNGQLFRYSGMVPEKNGRAVRRTETAVEPGGCYGNAAPNPAVG